MIEGMPTLNFAYFQNDDKKLISFGMALMDFVISVLFLKAKLDYNYNSPT